MHPDLGTPGHLLQEGQDLRQETPAKLAPGVTPETMHPLTNCFDDAAILELGPI